MAYAALTILLESLEQFSSPNRYFLLTKNHQLQSFNENLKFFQEFLQNSTRKMNHFEGKIRDVVYRAQDVIEEFVSSNPCLSEEPIDLFDEKFSIHNSLQQILLEIDSIKAVAINGPEKISADDSEMVKDLAVNNEIEEEISTKAEDTLMNLDEGMMIIVDRLLSPLSRLEIISILGENDRGKMTALARTTYDHVSVQKHFHVRLWISVDDNGVVRLPCSAKGEVSTRCQFGRKIDIPFDKQWRSKRYLVVVDVTATNASCLYFFEDWFPENNKGSRVIFLVRGRMGMTTSSCIDSPSTIHHSACAIWKLLPKACFGQKHKKDQVSLQLCYPKQDLYEAYLYLREKVFGEQSCPLDRSPALFEIVLNCAGVQEVLDNVASLLCKSSKTLNDWNNVSSNMGYVFEIFFPDESFYVYQDMEGLSQEVDSPGINQAKEQGNAVEENAVVGMDDDLIKIKDQLMGESHSLKIITVVGMGGIGKTTFAKAVFDDPLIQYHFYVRAWVTVSQCFQLGDLLLRLVQEVGYLEDEINIMSKEQLSEKLYKRLKGQRFLIVVDDLWSTEAWDYMKRCFPDDKIGSRILLTTRLKNLADHVSPNHSPHEMRFLNKDQSWELLHYRIFLKRSCPLEMVEIGKRIAEKCRGLPLSIVVLAGALSNMSETRECWENVAESMSSLLTSDPERCLEILALSYNYLPHHLKACFLYMCAFPEDCEIDCRRLMKLWGAEGFMKSESDRNLEDLAEEYLEDLINRSLVLVGKRSCNGKIKTCHIHDLLRDLSLREAQKENFIQVITKNIPLHPEDNIALRRLSFLSGSYGNFRFEHSIQLTRSFLCFEVGFDMIKEVHLCLSKFKLLRVLDIGFVRFDYFPLAILRLIHLRFLALTAACELPSSISELRNLQSLIVHGPWLSKRYGKNPTLPIEIWRISQLRHLNLSAAIYLPGPLCDQDNANSSLVLQNLQTLSTIRPASCTEQLFNNIPRVKKLGIRQIKEDLDTCGGSSNFLYKLVHLPELETLKCSFYVRNCKAIQLPDLNAFPQKLKNLTLSWSYLPWQDMDALGMLPNLEVLKLKNYAFQGSIWGANEDGFRSLKVLLIEKTDLVHWDASRYCFPRLESLVLRFCESLKEIPNDIADDMQLIELHYCSSSAESSAREIQEEQRNRDNDGLVVRIISKQQMSSAEPEDS